MKSFTIVSLVLSIANLFTSCFHTAMPPDSGPYYVEVRVEPIVVTNLGDRVTGPATIIVDAPGAMQVEAYLEPLDQPYGGKVIGESTLIGEDKSPSDGFKISWPVTEPFDYVQIYAIAYGQPDVNYSRISKPITIILDWRSK